MDEVDLYAILMVDETAEQAVVNAAYKALAARYHPDRNAAPDANARMQAINSAYAVLGDPQQRAEYDRQRNPFGRANGNGHRGNGHTATPAYAVVTDAATRARFQRIAQRIREVQEKSLQQIRAVEDRSSQQIRDIQDRAAQQVADVQNRAAQQVKEIQVRTAEQIRGLQDGL